jgi:hypothetical protein
LIIREIKKLRFQANSFEANSTSSMEKIEQKKNNKNERNRPEAMHPLLYPNTVSQNIMLRQAHLFEEGPVASRQFFYYVEYSISLPNFIIY